ncbi:unnamed protein product [Callosobruchus maculatus]|uniref:Uncharacterized protein n=1 Tax=Callosobruchus maculatus TaxID=64391 RepID=A0A653D8J2_CALMS|nr:unnamed protein product [Callosobruchus maculatus]
MASPSKKLRMSPGRDCRSLPLTFVTSTPQSIRRSSGLLSVSPQVSCIRGGSPCGSTTSGSTRSSNTSRSLFRDESESDSFIGNLDIGDDYEKYFQDIRRIKYAGRIWSLHRPLDDESLYGEILKRPQNAKEHVKIFYYSYQRDKNQAIKILFQFALHVSGFQKVQVPDIESSGAIKGLVDSLESIKVLKEHETLKKTGKCLLQERAVLAKPLQMGIYYFIHTLVMVGYENKVLFDRELFNKLIKLVKFMSESRISSVKYSGTVFVLKIITAAVKLSARVHEEMNEISDTHYDSLEELMQDRQDLDDLINIMYLFFCNKCGIADNKLMVLAIECAHEIKTWVKYFPKKFISDYEILKRMKTLSINPSKAVRYETLVVCESFVSTPQIWKQLQPVKDFFLKFVSDRLYDVDIKVSVKAVDVFIAVLQHRDSETTKVSDEMSDMVALIFDKVFPIASAACKFWTVFFDIESSYPEQTLLEILKITTMPNEYAKELVVEGFLPHCPVLRRWELYVDFLMEDDTEVDKKAVAALFSEVLRQVLTGKPSVFREKSVAEPAGIDFSEHSRISALLPHFNKILLKYKDDPAILKDILKIIPALHSVLLSSDYAKDCMTMWNIIRDLYAYHTAESVLEALADALFFFHTAVNFTSRAVTFTARFLETYTDRFQDYLENSSEEELSDAPLKIAVLYPHANLNPTVEWDKLLLQLRKCTDEINVYLMQCCVWYIHWELKSIIKGVPINLKALISNHRIRRDDLLEEIFSQIHKLNGSDQHYKVYSQLCDFLLKYQEELKPARKSDKAFGELNLDLNSDKVTIIKNFVDKYVIYKKEVPIRDKKRYFSDYLSLTHVGILPLEESAFAYRYYLKFNDEFGDIIERSMQYHIQSDSKTQLLLVILHTLISEYERILERYTVVAKNTQEFCDLRALTKKFQAHKYFRKPIHHFLNLLTTSIKYAFRNENNLEFLYLAKYFVDILGPKMDKQHVLNTIENYQQSNTKKNDAVMYFINYLKSLNIQQPPSTDDAASLLESLDIQDSEKSKLKGTTKVKTAPKDKGPQQKRNPKQRTEPKERKTSELKKTSRVTKPKTGAIEANKGKITKLTRDTSSFSDDLDSLEDYSVHDSSSDDLELMSDK